jgi:HSP20 family molecular chaperone IbpA
MPAIQTVVCCSNSPIEQQHYLPIIQNNMFDLDNLFETKFEQKDDRYELAIPLPEVHADNICVERNNDAVTVAIQRQQFRTVHHSPASEEVIFGGVSKEFRLPSDAALHGATMEFVNDILHVAVPKQTDNKKIVPFAPVAKYKQTRTAT